MKSVQRKLLATLWGSTALAAIIFALFETDALGQGAMCADPSATFALTAVMEMATLCAIPLALRLFKFKRVKRQLSEQREKALHKWGMTRMLILCVPMVANVMCYGLTVVPGFCYMAIILFLCLFFVYPSMERCVAEVADNDNSRS